MVTSSPSAVREVLGQRDALDGEAEPPPLGGEGLDVAGGPVPVGEVLPDHDLGRVQVLDQHGVREGLRRAAA